MTIKYLGCLLTFCVQMMKISWVSSPIALAIAQKYLAPEAWVPFFNLIAFTFGTCKLFIQRIYCFGTL